MGDKYLTFGVCTTIRSAAVSELQASLSAMLPDDVVAAKPAAEEAGICGLDLESGVGYREKDHKHGTHSCVVFRHDMPEAFRKSGQWIG